VAADPGDSRQVCFNSDSVVCEVEDADGGGKFFRFLQQPFRVQDNVLVRLGIRVHSVDDRNALVVDVHDEPPSQHLPRQHAVCVCLDIVALQLLSPVNVSPNVLPLALTDYVVSPRMHESPQIVYLVLHKHEFQIWELKLDLFRVQRICRQDFGYFFVLQQRFLAKLDFVFL